MELMNPVKQCGMETNMKPIRANDTILDSFFNDPLFNWTGLDYFPVFSRNRQDLCCDMYIEKDVLHINVNAPGVEKDQVSIEHDRRSNRLVVQISNQYEKKEDKPHFYIRERNISQMSRTFALPENIDGDTISADLNNGLLEIRANLAKPEEKPDTRQISIG